MSQTQATDQLEVRFRRLAAINGAADILNWDAATMLPKKSGDVRGEQLAALSEVTHELLTNPALRDLLQQAHSETLEPWRTANLREMQHRYDHANALPQQLVAAITRQRITSEHSWREARRTANYKSFLPEFKKMLQLTREEAAAKSTALNLSAYDAMLDGFDPGMRRTVIDPIFATLKTWLPDFVNQVIEHQKKKPALPLNATVPEAQQKTLGLAMMQRLGFDMSQGRIDSSTHPFCGGVPGDVRITTRYNPEKFVNSLYGVMHETGHALYEQGLPTEWRGLPVGHARGMSVHESQSLFVEMQLGRSAPFLRFLAPQLAQHFCVSGPAWSPENLQRALTKVSRSFIRVDADEVTYPLHVILRYELEQALLTDDLKAEDLPGAWAENMQHHLGVTPPDDAQGCLQDIHWPEGMLGYFPTYTLGAMLAAQLMASVRKAIPDLDAQLERGEFTNIIQWLNKHLHAQASLYPTPELITKATDEPLNPVHYEAHLKARYLGQA